MFVHDQKVYRLCPLNGLSRWKYPISLYLNLLQWSLHIQIFQPSGSQHVKVLLITSPSARMMGLYGKGYLLDAMSRIWYLLHAFLSTVCYSRTIVKKQLPLYFFCNPISHSCVLHELKMVVSLHRLLEASRLVSLADNIRTYLPQVVIFTLPLDCLSIRSIFCFW